MNWNRRPWLLGLLLLVGLVLLASYSLTVGARHIPLPTIWKALVNYDPSQVDELLVQTLRVPRLLLAVACGISFGVAGALMQGITNNPMASPSIMGVNSGAALGLAVAMILLPDSSLNVAVLFAFGGAALATVIIMALANRNGSRMSPVFLALAGTAVSAVLLAITQALVVYFDVAQDLSYWTAGGISGVRMPQVLLLWPWTLIGVAVLILCGSAVAIAGPIGFVGLVTPHMARQLVGIDYRKVIPITALLGAILLVGADLVVRSVAAPFEIPLGAITALIGVPFFLYLANRKGAR